MAAKPERAPRMRETLRASERRETSMAEAAAEPGGSPGPAAAPSPRGSAGPQEDERCPGGASAESGGAAPDPDSAADSEAVPNPPLRKGTPSSSGRRSRAAGSPGSLRLSPALGSPQGRRRSWRRCSLKGRRSRRKSLPPVHHEVSALSRSISLELPEVQRLSLLLLSSFQFSARQLRRRLQQSPGFDPELFSAQVQRGSEEFQRLLQRLLQDGTLGNCLEATPGDSLDPALEESVAQVKLLMARLSGELQAWDQLLQQHLQRAQLASRWMRRSRPGRWCWSSTGRAAPSSGTSRRSWLPERSGACRDPPRGGCCRRGPRRRCRRTGNKKKKRKIPKSRGFPSKNIPGFCVPGLGGAVLIGWCGCQSDSSANHRAEEV
ncbi:uncharacterized protein LOC119696605 isoform X1 [Motacilla alba alba]|uniref:uncharacterized protein LOC119696605 isoform X1 n=1 Tax=Motacilla alba alba TaxID=1094192 RepID=UPI0018D54B8C|nr:uncharacterized protein LOC119696605 isoform X1 [Motacilla alba alba]